MLLLLLGDAVSVAKLLLRSAALLGSSMSMGLRRGLGGQRTRAPGERRPELCAASLGRCGARCGEGGGCAIIARVAQPAG